MFHSRVYICYHICFNFCFIFYVTCDLQMIIIYLFLFVALIICWDNF